MVDVKYTDLVFKPLGFDVLNDDDTLETPREIYSLNDLDSPGFAKAMSKGHLSYDEFCNACEAAVADIIESDPDFTEIIDLDQYCEVSGEDISKYEKIIDVANRFNDNNGRLVLLRTGYDSYSSGYTTEPVVLIVYAVMHIDMANVSVSL